MPEKPVQTPKPKDAGELAPRRNHRVKGPRGVFFVLATSKEDAAAQYCNETTFPIERAGELEVALTEE